MESNQNKIWEIILGEVELSVPPATFKTWFEKASLLSVEDQHVSILVNNIFAKGQFETKYDAKIKQILVDNGFSKPTIEYIVNNKKVICNEAVIQIDEPTVSVASGPISGNRKTGLNPRYRFDNFIVGTCNDLAHAAAQAAASMPGQKYNPIFIYGGSGLGKTHLIQAIGNEIIAAHPEKRVLYVPTETFVNEFIDHVRYKKNRDFSKKYREVDVLIVVEMQNDFVTGALGTPEAQAIVPKVVEKIKNWKGPAKTVGLAVAGLAAVGAVLHGIFGRPNEVTPHEEQEAQELVDENSHHSGREA